MNTPHTINWLDPKSLLTEHFTVKEALYLPKWDILHIPNNMEMFNIVKLANTLESVRDLFGAPIEVHCWIRPLKVNCPTAEVFHGKNYNHAVGSKSDNSPHVHGKAVDFHVEGFEGSEGCARARAIILSHLEALGLRMEDIQGGWIHLDTAPVVHNRFFKP